MNATSKKSLSELIQLIKDGKVPQGDKDNCLAYLKNKPTDFFKSLQGVTEVNKEEVISADSVLNKTVGKNLIADAVPLGNGRGYEQKFVWDIYRDLPAGEYLFYLRDALVGKRALALMEAAIEAMREKVRTYGENSATIRSKSWVDHFIEYGLSIGCPGEVYAGYIWILYKINGQLFNEKHVMTISWLQIIEKIFNSLLPDFTDYDKLTKILEFLLGFVVTEFSSSPEAEIEYFLGYVEDVYERDDLNLLYFALFHLIDHFLRFMDKLVKRREQLYLSGDLLVPCSFYVDRVRDTGVIEVHLSFKIFGKQFNLIFYYSEVRIGGQQPLLAPFMRLDVIV